VKIKEDFWGIAAGGITGFLGNIPRVKNSFENVYERYFAVFLSVVVAISIVVIVSVACDKSEDDESLDGK
jgi:hypothetical protein